MAAVNEFVAVPGEIAGLKTAGFRCRRGIRPHCSGHDSLERIPE